MGVEKIAYPVNIEPLKAQIKSLEEEVARLKDRAEVLETEVKELKPKP